MHLVGNLPSIDGRGQPLTRSSPILFNQRSPTMGKKKSPHQWTVHLESVYRRDRDEQIAKVYALVSSEQQAQHGTIESQLAAIEIFAAEKGLKIDPDLIFAENGFSGATLARPKLDALRDKAVAGEIDAILVLDP